MEILPKITSLPHYLSRATLAQNATSLDDVERSNRLKVCSSSILDPEGVVSTQGTITKHVGGSSLEEICEINRGRMARIDIDKRILFESNSFDPAIVLPWRERSLEEICLMNSHRIRMQGYEDDLSEQSSRGSSTDCELLDVFAPGCYLYEG